MNSMTGMGVAKGLYKGEYWVVEIRSVNHKFCELNIKSPSYLHVFEPVFSTAIKKQFSRGKIDVRIGTEKKSSDVGIDKNSLKSYYKLLSEVAKELKINEKPGLSHLLMGIDYWMPKDQERVVDPKFFVGLIQKACLSLKKMRSSEGRNLKKIMQDKRLVLSDLVEQISNQRSGVIKSSRERLHKKIEELLQGVNLDESRLENEIAYILDRTDISEELDRLKSHFKQFDQMLGSVQPVGRSLDFLIQEMNRELNTITSKSQDASVAHLVVSAKSELEKIREQVQNIE